MGETVARIVRVKDHIAVSPMGYLLTGIGGTYLIKGVQRIAEGNDLGYGLAVFSAFLTLCGIGAIGQHHESYERLVKQFEKHGFDDATAKLFMTKWCDRNILRRAARATGHKKELKALKRKIVYEPPSTYQLITGRRTLKKTRNPLILS